MSSAEVPPIKNGLSAAFVSNYQSTSPANNPMSTVQSNGSLPVNRSYSKLVQRIKASYRVKSLFAVKPIEAFIAERENRQEGQSLAERLGVIDLLGYGVGCTVGAGIYSLIGIGAGIAGKP